MKTYLYYFFSIIFLGWMSLSLVASVPKTVQFTVVFDYANDPVQGTHNVVVRISNKTEVLYTELVPNVMFNKGVGSVVLGKESSDLLKLRHCDSNDSTNCIIFDQSDLDVEFSVDQHSMKFDITSIPYTIRAQESNRARRVDGEHIIKFLESERRVGIHNESPEVTLDVNGGVRIGYTKVSDSGSIFFDPIDSLFKAYVGDDAMPKVLTFNIDPDEFSKWDWVSESTKESVYTMDSVVIGKDSISNDIGLLVSGNMHVTGDVTIKHNVYVSDILDVGGFGFDASGTLSVNEIALDNDNTWQQDKLIFSGVLSGKAHKTDLKNLQNFEYKVFKTNHFSTGNALISSTHLNDSISFSSDHIQSASIATKDIDFNGFNMAAFVTPHAIQADHIADKSIQTQHVQRIHFYQDPGVTFDMATISDNAIVSFNIKPGVLSYSKLSAQSVLSRHIKDDAIVSSNIKAGTLDASHVSKNSISVDALQVITIEEGGTGDGSFVGQNGGVLYVNSDSKYVVDNTILRLFDSGIRVGDSPASDVQAKWHLVNAGATANVELVSGASDKSSELVFKTFLSTWNVGVNGFSNAFYFTDSETPILTITSGQGFFGIGSENTEPVESISLSSGITLGTISSINPDPGTLAYQSDHIVGYKAGGTTQISASSLHQRYFNQSLHMYAQNSSIIHVEASRVDGSDLLIYSVYDSTIMGNDIYGANVNNSSVMGQDAIVFGGVYASLVLRDASAYRLRRSKVNADQSDIVDVQDSYVNMRDSSVMFGRGVSLNIGLSKGQFLTDTVGDVTHSEFVGLHDVNVVSEGSFLGHIQSSSIETYASDLRFLDHVSAISRASSIGYADHSVFDVQNSMVQHVSDSNIMGSNLFVMGGNRHDISGDDHVSLMGDDHVINGDKNIVIGHNIHSDYDNGVLLNTSRFPLKADRDAQFKLQSDGDIILQFSPDTALSMADSFGSWSHISDKHMKTVLGTVLSTDVLDKVRQLPIQYWEYKSQENVAHLGPTAQDFSRFFRYGNSDTLIHSIDSDGVLLSSIQALFYEMNDISSQLDVDNAQYSLDMHSLYHVQSQMDTLQLGWPILEAKLKRYTRVMEQLFLDYESQEHMLAYLETYSKKMEIRYFLRYLFLPIRLFFVLVLGVLLGVLIAYVRSRRAQP
jgi:hypothetical protein